MLANAFLKEAIGKYTTQRSYVHTCFMDMNKAFERVNHYIFLRKPIELKISPMIDRASSFLLKKSTVRVRYKDS